MTNLVDVTCFYSPEEAYCANSYLQAYGIQTVVMNGHHLNVVPSYRVALGGYVISCPVSQY